MRTWPVPGQSGSKLPHSKAPPWSAAACRRFVPGELAPRNRRCPAIPCAIQSIAALTVATPPAKPTTRAPLGGGGVIDRRLHGPLVEDISRGWMTRIDEIGISQVGVVDTHDWFILERIG